MSAAATGPSAKPTVFVVDDDPAIGTSLKALCESVGLATKSFQSATEFIETYDPNAPGCVIIDVRLPGMSGLELQSRLNERGNSPPVIFLTGYGDVPTTVRAMRAGALDVLEKPFAPQLLLERIQQAIALDAQWRSQRTQRELFLARQEELSHREREIMAELLTGKTVKRVAAQYGLSHKTVQVHRARILRKMRAHTVAELICQAVAAGWPFAKPGPTGGKSRPAASDE